MATDYETLRYETDGHVTVLTYDRPEQRNAVNRVMNAELHDAWRRFRDDDSARHVDVNVILRVSRRRRPRRSARAGRRGHAPRAIGSCRSGIRRLWPPPRN